MRRQIDQDSIIDNDVARQAEFTGEINGEEWEFPMRAVQILLGHAKIESTIRHLGVDVEGALALSERTEV